MFFGWRVSITCVGSSADPFTVKRLQGKLVKRSMSVQLPMCR